MSSNAALFWRAFGRLISSNEEKLENHRTYSILKEEKVIEVNIVHRSEKNKYDKNRSHNKLIENLLISQKIQIVNLMMQPKRL